MTERHKNRSLRMSLSVASLFEKLSTYTPPPVDAKKRSYEKLASLCDSSQDIVNILSDEINKEFDRCHPQN